MTSLATVSMVRADGSAPQERVDGSHGEPDRPMNASQPSSPRLRPRGGPSVPIHSTRDAMSAGGVVYRIRDGQVQVVLVARPAHGLWALPKGTPEAGESVEQTAIREVTEETGLDVSIEREIGSVHYRYAVPGEGILIRKVVHHFLMEPLGGDIARHDHEYDVVDWVDIHEATERMSYANERRIVQRAGELIQEHRT